MHDKFDKDKDNDNIPSIEFQIEVYDKLLIKGFEYIKKPRDDDEKKKTTEEEPKKKKRNIKPKRNGYTYVRLE